jgi:hypothetical protein
MVFNPTCICHVRPIPNRPLGFHGMSSVQMRAYGEANDRPDIVMHADCVEQREKLDRLSDEFEELDRLAYRLNLPQELKEKISRVNVFLLSGEWYDSYPFPEDGIFAEGDRLREAFRTARGAESSTRDTTLTSIINPPHPTRNSSRDASRSRSRSRSRSHSHSHNHNDEIDDIEDVLVAPGLLNGRNDTIQGLTERRNDTIERLTQHCFTGMAYKFSVESDSWVEVEV